ncbi:hypothetical protein BSKO_08155 [Bryopsis sp. KO-2023]|nr:hypothetical protein BSKO_08155 [Bryopsis sp. KO-2023]
MKMTSCFVFCLVLACVCLCANAQTQDSFRKWPLPDSTCAKDTVSCGSDIDCFRSCQSLSYECVGCPKCPNSSELDGSCFLKGTVAVRCVFPTPNNPGCGGAPPPPVCDTNSKCSSDAECELGCGKGSKCQGCNTGCPGSDVPSCVPSGEFKICPAVICEPQEPPCKRAGCSSELCVEASREDFATICLFRPEFVCFRDAQCGKFGPGDSCAFKQTKELVKCLEENRQDPVILEAAGSGP